MKRTTIFQKNKIQSKLIKAPADELLKSDLNFDFANKTTGNFGYKK